MKRQSNDDTADTNGSSSLSAGVERMPKVRLDVLTSRLLHERDYGELSSSTSSSSLSSMEFGAVDTAAATMAASSHGAAICMPLYALARAEAQLKRPVPLSHGGMTIHFSREDIQQITDPEVLRLLADSGESKEKTNTTSTTGMAAVTSDIEARMDALQREIDTFITAVDSEGRCYEIRMGASGEKEMLIADEELEAPSEEEDGEDIEREQSTEEDSIDTSTRAPSASAPDSHTHTTTEKLQSDPAKPSASFSQKATATAPLLFTKQKQQKKQPPGAEKSARVHRAHPPLTPSPLPSSSHAVRSSSSRVKLSTQPPVIPVRPQAGLTEAEETRVDQLLDDTAFAALTKSNPFTCLDALTKQLAELERQISRYVAVRGGSQVSCILGSPPAVSDDDAADSVGINAAPTATVTATTMALGNAYMRHSHEAEQAARRLRTVNERLRVLKCRDEVFAMVPAENTPADIVALRPSWAQPAAFTMTESEVQKLLASARAEEAKACEVGLTTAAPLPTADPFAGLRDGLRSAGSRAMELLKQYNASPPVMRRTPSPVSGDDEGLPDERDS